MQAGWTLKPDLRVRAWDGDVLVYVPASGDTHLLEDRLARAFEHLSRRDDTHAVLIEDLDTEALNTLATLGIAREPDTS